MKVEKFLNLTSRYTDDLLLSTIYTTTEKIRFRSYSCKPQTQTAATSLN